MSWKWIPDVSQSTDAGLDTGWQSASKVEEGCLLIKRHLGGLPGAALLLAERDFLDEVVENWSEGFPCTKAGSPLARHLPPKARLHAISARPSVPFNLKRASRPPYPSVFFLPRRRRDRLGGGNGLLKHLKKRDYKDWPQPVVILVPVDTKDEPETASPTCRPRLVGRSAAVRTLIDSIDRLLTSRVRPRTILLEGESGTGKTTVARLIHARLGRKVFVPLSCGSIQGTIADNELFGHVEGAFTNASSSQPGAVERADGGTLFLDDINHLEMAAQPRLLQVIDERAFSRIGAAGVPLHSDFVLIAATSEDLEVLSRTRRFLPDLYNRLRTARVRLPPLRERLDDLEELTAEILSVAFGIDDLQFSPDGFELLRRREGTGSPTWPGNLRDLRDLIGQCLNYLPADRKLVDSEIVRQVLSELDGPGAFPDHHGFSAPEKKGPQVSVDRLRETLARLQMLEQRRREYEDLLRGDGRTILEKIAEAGQLAVLWESVLAGFRVFERTAQDSGSLLTATDFEGLIQVGERNWELSSRSGVRAFEVRLSSIEPFVEQKTQRRIYAVLHPDASALEVVIRRKAQRQGTSASELRATAEDYFKDLHSAAASHDVILFLKLLLEVDRVFEGEVLRHIGLDQSPELAKLVEDGPEELERVMDEMEGYYRGEVALKEIVADRESGVVVDLARLQEIRSETESQTRDSRFKLTLAVKRSPSVVEGDRPRCLRLMDEVEIRLTFGEQR